MTGEPMTKGDFDSSMKSFGALVKAESKAGTIEAIGEHEEKCHERNKELFVTEKDCAVRRETCKKGVYKSIDYRNKNKSIQEEEDKSGYVKVKFPEHVKSHKATYGVGLFALIELIAGIIYIFI